MWQSWGICKNGRHLRCHCHCHCRCRILLRVFRSNPHHSTSNLLPSYSPENRIHLKITDTSEERYEVPESAFPRPQTKGGVTADSAAIQFNYTKSPFSFSIFRSSTNEVLFTTASHPIIFEPQYWRVKTTSPSASANFYGLGEHTNGFRLNPFNTTRTLWNLDNPSVPANTNLYGDHPVYFEHRSSGTHGVLLLNSNGIDVKINNTENADETTLEYNVIGGVIDMYFLAGSEEDPVEITRQYADIVGTPAEVPYWSFGFHQCRFNYTGKRRAMSDMNRK